MRKHSSRDIWVAVDAHDRRRAGLPNPAGWRRALTGSALMIAAMCFGTSAKAAVGDQIIVRDLIASKGWTSLVPMLLNGDDGFSDLLSYNAKTGRAVYSVGANPPGSQTIVKDLIASKGWTAVVPMRLNDDSLTDLLSYNATTGRAVYSIAATP